MERPDPVRPPGPPPGAHALTLLRELRYHGVRFVLLGRASAWAHGAQVPIGDIDICPDPDRDNLERLAACLADVRARPIEEGTRNRYGVASAAEVAPEARDLDGLYSTNHGMLDVIISPYGHGGLGSLSFEELESRAQTRIYSGEPLRVAAVDDLVASKLGASSPKDRTTVEELRRATGSPKPPEQR